MKTKKKQPHPTRRPAPALPPIPRNTTEGARLHGIADAIRALFGHLELQSEDIIAAAKELNVPVLFVALTYYERYSDTHERESYVVEFVEWRQQWAVQ